MAIERTYYNDDGELKHIDNKPVLKLVGFDGNAFYILGKARRVLKEHGYSKEQIEGITEEATSGDYNNLLQVMMKYFEVE